MFKSQKTIKSVSIVTIFLALLPGNVGCGLIAKKPEFAPYTIEYNITDKDVLEFVNNLRHMLRLKMEWSTIGAYFTSSLALATAAAAAVYGATGGSKTATAALTGSSIFTSDLYGLLELGRKTPAYQDGVALLERAEARYYIRIAEGYGGKVSKTKLTVAGANLYLEAAASLRLVEKALASQIPTSAEVEAATGKHLDKLERIRLSETEVTLPLTGKDDKQKPTRNVQVYDTGAVTTAISEDESIATANVKENVIRITGEKVGDTRVIVSNDKGAQGEINVKVRSDIEGEVRSKRNALPEETVDIEETVEINEGETITIIVSESKSPLKRISLLGAKQEFIATDYFDSEGTPQSEDLVRGVAMIKGTTKGRTIITIENVRGGKKEFVLEVK